LFFYSLKKISWKRSDYISLYLLVDTVLSWLLFQLKAPDAAHFALVSNPLHDQILERRSLEGGTSTSSGGGASSSTRGAHVPTTTATSSSNNAVTHVLHSDAVGAKRAAANPSLPLRERLAAAVAGARLDAVADLRQSQVVQDQALSTLARATATRALTETATDSGACVCLCPRLRCSTF